MSNIDISISFDLGFGSIGSNNGEFQFPSGICVLNSELFVVDKQNHRIQVSDLSGNYIRQFGTVGSGNDNLFFPEGIDTDGTDLFIVDGANHRIKKHQIDGTYLSQFGSVGSGNNNFNYPIGIDVDVTNSIILIADKANSRIKVHDLAGSFVFEFGSYGSNDTQFNFPEGISIFDNKIYVADSGNGKVKAFNIAGLFLFSITSKPFSYPVGISNIEDSILCVVDRTNNDLSFFDNTGQLITDYGSQGAGLDEFFFPQNSFFIDDKLYITDSGNHRIKILNAVVEDDIPLYAGEIIKLTKQLYPTGRSWWLNYKKTFYKTHEGLSYSESRAIENSISVLNSIIPDNALFTLEDAVNWERALGLISNLSISLEDRKQAILRKMNHPGDIPARQHYLYLQGQLQAAGFNVFVHENRFETVTPGVYEVVDPDTLSLASTQYGSVQYSANTQYGGGSSSIDYTLIGNYIDVDEESLNLNSISGNALYGRAQYGAASQYGSGSNITRDELLRATFFIGAETFPGFGNVPLSRRDEFRELILKIKPTQTVGVLFINYV